MATSFSVPIDAFLRRVEKDRDYFRYFELTDEDAMALAESRANVYLHEAAARMMIDGKPTVDLLDMDDDLELFNIDLTSQEVFIIAWIMFEMYMSRDIAQIKLQNVNFTPTELRVFSPNDARTTFQSLYESVCQKNIDFLDTYKNTDRLTGEYRGITYSNYDEE